MVGDYVSTSLAGGDTVNGGSSFTRYFAMIEFSGPDRCSVDTCQLYVGFVTSPDGGATWSPPQTLAGPISLTWLASTNQGPMSAHVIGECPSFGRYLLEPALQHPAVCFRRQCSLMRLPRWDISRPASSKTQLPVRSYPADHSLHRPPLVRR